MPQESIVYFRENFAEPSTKWLNPRGLLAFPELLHFGESPSSRTFQCSGQNSVAPSGRVANRFEIHPDWAIEILSPDQSQTKCSLTCSIAQWH